MSKFEARRDKCGIKFDQIYAAGCEPNLIKFNPKTPNLPSFYRGKYKKANRSDKDDASTAG